jgi:hypothetical protein
MTPLAQVVHVVKKDLRLLRWPLAAFAVVLAMVAALNDRDAQLVGSSVIPILAVIAGMLLVATLVQEQSPSAADASWRVLPLSPAAVFVAKLLMLAMEPQNGSH